MKAKRKSKSAEMPWYKVIAYGYMVMGIIVVAVAAMVGLTFLGWWLCQVLGWYALIVFGAALSTVVAWGVGMSYQQWKAEQAHARRVERALRVKRVKR